jgi:transposase
MKYVGMDVHKKTTTFCVLDEGGHVVSRGQVDSDEESWTSIIGTWPAAEVRVALETGNMTWWVVDVLREVGVEPVVVDARQFKLIAHSKKKSDKHDARALADALRGGLAERCAVHVPSERARRGRSLLRTRQLVVKQSVSTMNAARSMLRSVGVHVSKKTWSKSDSWEALLSEPSIPKWMKPLLATYRETWEFLESKRASLTAMVTEELHHWPEVELLQDLPGYGPLVTLGVLAHLDDPHRFHRSNQVAGYAGLVPTCRDSGESVRRGGITHQGSSILRHLMIQASWAALRSNALTPDLRKWARRLIVKRGIRIAVVALARRLLVLACRLWKNGEVYNPMFQKIKTKAA